MAIGMLIYNTASGQKLGKMLPFVFKVNTSKGVRRAQVATSGLMEATMREVSQILNSVITECTSLLRLVKYMKVNLKTICSKAKENYPIQMAQSTKVILQETCERAKALQFTKTGTSIQALGGEIRCMGRACGLTTKKIIKDKESGIQASERNGMIKA